MLADLQHNLSRIAAGINADWAIYVKFMQSGEEIAMNADKRVDTMSVIKVPLLVTLYREAEAGRVDLDQRISLTTRHKRFGTGVLKMMADGLNLTLRDAARLMIVLSDNTATDICYEAIGGPNKVMALMRELALLAIEVTGTAFDWFSALAAEFDPSYAELAPDELFRKGYPSVTPYEQAAIRERFHFETNTPFSLASPRDIGRLLEMLWAEECASPASCKEMKEILKSQIYESRIPKYLFAAPVGHKTGDFQPLIANDAGVIEPFGRAPIIACFFASRHRGIWTNLEDAIARMSEKIWEYSLCPDAGRQR
jgi:beta-lactamase class A